MSAFSSEGREGGGVTRDTEKSECSSVCRAARVYHVYPHEPRVQAGFMQLSSWPVAGLTCTAFS